MKLLAALLTLTFASIVMADIPRPNPPKPKPKSSIYSIIKKGSYEVKVATPRCAPQARCIGGTPVTTLVLTLPLQGCLDSSIVSYSVKENPNNSDVKVIVSAINVANPKSMAALCVKAPEDTKTIVLGSSANSKNVSVEFVQQLAQ